METDRRHSGGGSDSYPASWPWITRSPAHPLSKLVPRIHLSDWISVNKVTMQLLWMLSLTKSVVWMRAQVPLKGVTPSCHHHRVCLGDLSQTRSRWRSPVLLLCLLTLWSGCWSGPGVYSSWCCWQTQQVWRSCITCAAWTGCSRHEDTEHSPSLLLPLWSHLCRWDRICHLSVWAVHRAAGSRVLDVSSDDIRTALESHGVVKWPRSVAGWMWLIAASAVSCTWSRFSCTCVSGVFVESFLTCKSFTSGLQTLSALHL